jgi:hypothetical protein
MSPSLATEPGPDDPSPNSTASLARALALLPALPTGSQKFRYSSRMRN